MYKCVYFFLLNANWRLVFYTISHFNNLLNDKVCKYGLFDLRTNASRTYSIRHRRIVVASVTRGTSGAS